MPAQDEITAKLGGGGGNRGGMGKAKTTLYQEHHVKPGKHDYYFFNRIRPGNNSHQGKKRGKGILTFLKNKR